ncbi:hypothetical protein ASG56_20775 [Rhodococcus sp. Leaf7]|uniref:acyl-CoA dehydrogenase family protein n=1 Tax=unclassified Rhodococcus (in: high G+C Gram-positive bacteria) TaxID=192944 RepID=UPI0006F4C317|nr:MULTISPECIES: acyl-CoA dehydrogenase family protein [unclassified Rhodococcus (in: high G+C Gram-positive bacteria)]KQU01954.1 hypothetical protein ASG56_20775 [Rhodococcus sp. Leaf7]KQU38247.1 hypothetical protein ASG64_20745 [Rhodococcus sp. Leaf247]
MTTMDIEAPAAMATHDELVERARALAPILRERAVPAELDRNVSAETMADIVAAGLGRVMTPRKWGGYELGFETVSDTCLELAKGCTSSAWLASFLGAHSWLLSHFPEQAQADVWSDGPDVSIGGIFAPMGKAKAVDGGYVLDGRWPWSSGIIHDEWTILGAFIEGQTPPKLHMFLIAPGDFTWEDTWHNVGLSASGSHDTVVENAFVPTHRVMPFEWARDGVGPGVESLGSSLYQVPLAPGFSYNAAYVALGAARGAYEYLREWTKSRASSVTGAGVAEHPSTQAELTETAVELDSAQLLLERTGRRILNPAALDLKTRVECRRDNVYSVKVILSALDRMQRMAGARGMYVSNPIQRAWRDAHAIATHVVFNFQTVGEFYGRLELGLEPPTRDPYF